MTLCKDYRVPLISFKSNPKIIADAFATQLGITVIVPDYIRQSPLLFSCRVQGHHQLILQPMLLHLHGSTRPSSSTQGNMRANPGWRRSGITFL